MLTQPIVLKPRMVARVWGGDRIARRFGRNGSSSEPIGESWEVHGELEVAHGELAGRTLDQLVAEFGTRLLGRRNEGCHDFPLLTKWLDCHDWLSVQVHPDDQLARELTGDERSRGKSEAWYVADSDEGSRLIHGLVEGATATQLVDCEGEGVLPLLNRMTPEIGDLLFTPAGTVHALGPGALIYEVQQSSDLTYRFFDWGRDRPIHPHEAGRCALEATSPPYRQQANQGVCCAYFEIVVHNQESSVDVCDNSFHLVAAAAGDCTLEGSFGSSVLAAGSTLLLPAGLGGVTLKTTGTALTIHVPEALE